MISAAVAKSSAAARQGVPWWMPTWPVTLGFGLYAMSFWVLYVLAPPQGQEPSELFKTLAGAVVITAFINGVVAAVYTASRDSQQKNATIAAQAHAIAKQASSTTDAN
ncbi:MAG TPA: hypothetical protein VHW05_07680 [Phenylobacterium sp.]|jgi:hypothetical protein|nr:hypothetical protein [Phenylobacterium sp.]